MKYSIDETELEKQNISFDEFILLAYLVFVSNNKLSKMNSLKDKGFINVTKKKGYVTNAGISIIKGILLDREITTKPEPNRCLQLAIKINEIFPEGKMPNGSYYFRCGKKELAERIEKFFEKYGDFTDEQILEATRKYVESKQNDMSTMRTAKYFIWKDCKKLNQDGELVVEESSDLATMIENLDDNSALTDYEEVLR